MTFLEAFNRDKEKLHSLSDVTIDIYIKRVLLGLNKEEAAKLCGVDFTKSLEACQLIIKHFHKHDVTFIQYPSHISFRKTFNMHTGWNVAFGNESLERTICLAALGFYARYPQIES